MPPTSFVSTRPIAVSPSIAVAIGQARPTRSRRVDKLTQRRSAKILNTSLLHVEASRLAERASGRHGRPITGQADARQNRYSPAMSVPLRASTSDLRDLAQGSPPLYEV